MDDVERWRVEKLTTLAFRCATVNYSRSSSRACVLEGSGVVAFSWLEVLCVRSIKFPSLKEHFGVTDYIELTQREPLS